MEDFPDLTGKTILQITPELSAGGVEQTVLEVTEAIKEAGGRALLASKGGRLEPRLSALGGELIRMNAKSKNPVVLKLNEWKLRKLIREANVDIVHARSRAPAWSAFFAARACGVPFVTTYHGAYSASSRMKHGYNSIMTMGDIVIANSEWIADHIRKTYDLPASRIVTIPRGVDIREYDPALIGDQRVEFIRASLGLVNDDRLVLFLPARLTEWKGQLIAIQALGLLAPEERDGIVLVMAGDAQGRTEYVARLQTAITEAGLERSVILVPHVSDMPAAYLASDIVLAPSVRPEAFGRVAAEGAAMGRPVIVTDHGGGRETVIEGETGARVEPGDPAALAGAIRAMIAIGPDARRGMGQAGRAHIDAHFSKRGLQAATLGVYKRLLDKQ